MSSKESLETNIETDCKNQRLAWVDNLRAAVVILVVHFHSCITYSHVGGWYLKDGPEGTLTDKLPYIFWIFHLQSFFMGLLFFVAGAMAAGAISRHGTSQFVRERVIRLGIPALLYMFLLHPLIVFEIMAGKSQKPDGSGWAIYSDYITSGQVLSGSGPLWFVLALLLFCLGYAAARKHIPALWLSHQTRLPGIKAFISLALFLAVSTALTRVIFPIGSSVFNFQLGYFPQYITLFTVGILVARKGWLNALVSTSWAAKSGLLALVGGPILLASILLIGQGPSEGPDPGEHGPILYFGGWNSQAFSAAFWEQFTGLGLAIGMMVLFKRTANIDNSLTRWLASRSFAVYVFHAPILVWLTLLFQPLIIAPLAKIMLLTITGLILSYGAADLAKRLWGIRRLF